MNFIISCKYSWSHISYSESQRFFCFCRGFFVQKLFSDAHHLLLFVETLGKKSVSFIRYYNGCSFDLLKFLIRNVFERAVVVVITLTVLFLSLSFVFCFVLLFWFVCFFVYFCLLRDWEWLLNGQNIKMAFLLLLLSVMNGDFIAAIAKLRKATISFVLYVCPSVSLPILMEQLDFHWKDFE